MDGRGRPLVIGQGTNDDDEVFDVVAQADPLSFVRESARQIFAASRISVKEGSERKLRLELREFRVEESNKAVGSMYSASVAFHYTLLNGSTPLVSGDASGSAERYGRERSAANCSEVLSDALKDAVAAALENEPLQKAWVTGTAPAPPSESPAPSLVEERLLKLKDLYDRSVITKEEYETRRAEILKEL